MAVKAVKTSVAVQVNALPGEVGGGVDTLRFLADQVVLEEHLGPAEALVADCDVIILQLEGFGIMGYFLQENLHQKEEQHEKHPSA